MSDDLIIGFSVGLIVGGGGVAFYAAHLLKKLMRDLRKPTANPYAQQTGAGMVRQPMTQADRDAIDKAKDEMKQAVNEIRNDARKR
jgi:hypothetical protein